MYNKEMLDTKQCQSSVYSFAAPWLAVCLSISPTASPTIFFSPSSKGIVPAAAFPWGESFFHVLITAARGTLCEQAEYIRSWYDVRVYSL